MAELLISIYGNGILFFYEAIEIRLVITPRIVRRNVPYFSASLPFQ